VAWSNRFQVSGASWVVRDAMGKMLLHSRRSYSHVHSMLDAKIRSWEWALTSIAQHHFDRVTFGASTHDIIKALYKLEEWPALLGHTTQLLKLSQKKSGWFMALEPKLCNTGAYEIAKSVITGHRWQSYVSRGFPYWLGDLFASEMTQPGRM